MAHIHSPAQKKIMNSRMLKIIAKSAEMIEGADRAWEDNDDLDPRDLNLRIGYFKDYACMFAERAEVTGVNVEYEKLDDLASILIGDLLFILDRRGLYEKWQPMILNQV